MKKIVPSYILSKCDESCIHCELYEDMGASWNICNAVKDEHGFSRKLEHLAWFSKEKIDFPDWCPLETVEEEF